MSEPVTERGRRLVQRYAHLIDYDIRDEFVASVASVEAALLARPVDRDRITALRNALLYIVAFEGRLDAAAARDSWRAASDVLIADNRSARGES